MKFLKKSSLWRIIQIFWFVGQGSSIRPRGSTYCWSQSQSAHMWDQVRSNVYLSHAWDGKGAYQGEGRYEDYWPRNNSECTPRGWRRWPAEAGRPMDSPTERRKTGRRMTERRMTERRKTGRRMTKRRMTERRMTEHQMTEHRKTLSRKIPNTEWPNAELDQTLKKWHEFLHCKKY